MLGTAGTRVARADGRLLVGRAGRHRRRILRNRVDLSGSSQSSDAVLARLLASAESGGVCHIARLLDSAAFSVAAFERKNGEIRLAYLN